MVNNLDKTIWNYQSVWSGYGILVSISAVLLIVLAMNLVFWGMKPKKDGSEK